MYVIFSVILLFFFFFFKQKTAYEMLRSLVGSEMCIRDRYKTNATIDVDPTNTNNHLEETAAAIPIVIAQK